MKNFLNEIRKPQEGLSLATKVRHTLLIVAIGIVLGVFSKWLDILSIDDTILWQHLIGVLDLGNFFSGFSIWLFIALAISVFSQTPLRACLNTFLFFVGMTVSYHLYTVLFSGFNPSGYMMIWYGITLVSPLLAFVCWYAKSNHKISIIISSLIFFVMFSTCFSMGMWYFGLRGILDFLVFVGTCIVLYVSPKNTGISILLGLILAFLIRIPFFMA